MFGLSENLVILCFIYITVIDFIVSFTCKTHAWIFVNGGLSIKNLSEIDISQGLDHKPPSLSRYDLLAANVKVSHFTHEK